MPQLYIMPDLFLEVLECHLLMMQVSARKVFPGSVCHLSEKDDLRYHLQQ